MSQAPRVDREDRQSLDGYLASWHATMKLLRAGRSFSGRERNCAFLNRRGEAFADVSSILGIDFPDDGRAIAMTDWDHDGDLDIWFHNRTGPRLRLMQNNAAATNDASSLALKLRGVRCNRDAIGARVRLELVGQSKPILRTVSAGDAYLSQSSKWLHFGLGENAKIQSAQVRWPNGEVESILGLESGGRFVMQEGAGRAEAVDADSSVREVQLQPSEQPRSVLPKWERVAFVNPLTLPAFEVTDKQGMRMPLINQQRQLIVFWASWCPTCLAELAELEKSHEQLTAAGIKVTLVNVDAASQTESVVRTKPWAAEQRYDSTHADRVLIDKLQLVQRIVLNHELPFAVPLTLLVDEQGGLAALYRGSTPLAAILQDAKWLGRPMLERRQAAIPFSGTWTTSPRTLLMRPVATLFREQGYDQDAVNYLKQDFELLEARRKAVATDDELRQADLQFAQASFNIGRSLQLQGQREEAIQYYQQGLSVLPNSAQANFFLGSALAEMGQPAQAIAALQSAVRLDGNLSNARLQLAKMLRAQGNLDEANAELEHILQQRPDDVDANFAMGLLQASKGEQAAALDSFLKVVSAAPTRVDAWTNAGSLLAKLGRLNEAKAALERAIDLDESNLQARISLGGLYGASADFNAARRQFQRALELDPQSNPARQGLIQSLLRTGAFVKAGKQLEEAIRSNPRDINSVVRLAWLRATAANEDARNGDQSVRLASQLAKVTRYGNPKVLDVLAAAYAETSQFDLAVETQQKAIDLIRGKDDPSQLQKRLELYQTQQPYRESLQPSK